MTETIFLTILNELGHSIDILRYQLDQAEKENRELHDQLNDLFIKIHIGKENEQ